MRKILILMLMLVVLSHSAMAEKTKDEINSLNKFIFDGLIKENYIKTNRVTIKGVIASCEIVFQNTYTDVRGVNGTVALTGSFSLMYFKENHRLGSSLKLVPNAINFKTEKWTVLYPVFADILINGNSLEKNKKSEFKSDTGGKIIAYADTGASLDMVKLIATTTPFDAEIRFSLVSGGMDNEFKLSSLSAEQLSEQERVKFNKCVLEEVKQIRDDLENSKD